MSDIIKEYAKALFTLAMENGKEQEYAESLDLLNDIFCENPQYLQLLSSPGIPLSERCDVLDKAFSDKLPTQVISFVKLLCERRYVNDFNLCILEYKKLLNEIKKTSSAKVISAVELSEKERTALKEKLEKMSGRTVVLECEVDKSILGGLVVEIDGKTVNASIKEHLKNVKDVIRK